MADETNTNSGAQTGGEGAGAQAGATVTKLQQRKPRAGKQQQDKPAGETDELQASDTHVIMRRDPEKYRAPHRAHVHRDEIENYAMGGWEIESE